MDIPIDENIKNKHREPLLILVIAASVRTGSLNANLAQLTVAAVIIKRSAIADNKSIVECDCPTFNNDTEKESGTPSGVE